MTLAQSIFVAATIQFLILAFASLLLDGEVLFHECLFAAVGYWVGIGMIGVRRGGQFNRNDRLFVGLGFPILLLVALGLSAAMLSLKAQ